MVTRRQRDVLQAIDAHARNTGWPPSVRDLAVNLGLASASTVYHHLELLREQGLIETQGPRKQGVRLTLAGMSALNGESLVA